MEKHAHFRLFMTILFFAMCCRQKPEEANIGLVENKSIIVQDSIFVSQYGGYGYDIIMNGEVKIHQPQIPVIAGNIGFISAEDAHKTARLVIAKMRNNQFPPRLSSKELQEIGIVFAAK